MTLAAIARASASGRTSARRKVTDQKEEEVIGNSKKHEVVGDGKEKKEVEGISMIDHQAASRRQS